MDGIRVIAGTYAPDERNSDWRWRGIRPGYLREKPSFGNTSEMETKLVLLHPL